MRFNDIHLFKDNIYFLGCYPLEDGDWKNSVYTINSDGEYELIAYFTYPIYAYSFEYDGENFYFGMGIPTQTNTKNGKILFAKSN